MKNNKFNIVSAAVIAGAFISYTVGSGFASGNEVLQFFGSWGMPASILAIDNISELCLSLQNWF